MSLRPCARPCAVSARLSEGLAASSVACSEPPNVLPISFYNRFDGPVWKGRVIENGTMNPKVKTLELPNQPKRTALH